MHYRSQQNPTMYNSSTRRRSTSLDSSPLENLPRKHLLPPRIVDHDNNEDRYIEQRRLQSNEYHKSPHESNTTSIVPTLLNNKDLAEYYERQYASRKLSSISERTEKTETDESEPDLLRLKYHPPNRKATISTVQEKFQLSVVPPKKTPIIKARRKPVREDENDHDSGVERSSSEKSFDDHSNLKLYTEVPALPPKSKQTNNTNNNSSTSLSFSNVFITSVSQSQSAEDELKRPLVHRSSQRSRSKDSITPKPILKKPSHQTSPLRIPADYYSQKKSASIFSKTSPLLKNIPKPNPRMSLKQHNSLL